jgi:hypothetical protein
MTELLAQLFLALYCPISVLSSNVSYFQSIMATLLKLSPYVYQRPSNVLECDIQCCKFQGGGERHIILF